MKERLFLLLHLFESYSQELSEDLEEELLQYISDDTVDIKFKARTLLFLRKHSKTVNPEKLSKVMNVDVNAAREILANEIIQVNFPLANNETSRLSSLYVIKTKSHIYFSNRNDPKNLLKTLSELTKQGFFAIFEEDFTGDSFMLAIAAALITKEPKILKHYAFTGAIDKEGNILPVDYINIKTTTAEKHGKTLIHSGILKNIRELELFLNSEKIDIPFSIALKESDNSLTVKESAINNLREIEKIIEKSSGIETKAVKKIYKIKEEDMIFHINNPPLPEKSWLEQIRESYIKIKALKSKIQDKIPVIHFAFLGPASFAFALGTLVGCKSPFVIYHRQNYKFYKVFDYRDRDLRELKEIKGKMEKLCCTLEIPENSNTLGMIFYLASHNPVGDATKYLSENYKTSGRLICSSKKHQGSFSPADWTEYVKEMYTSYNKTKNLPISKRIIFLSCPVAIAFCFGIVVETSENADVMNFGNNNNYYKVFNLREGMQLNLSKSH